MHSIHDSFVHGSSFQHGNYVTIEEDVVVGDDVRLGHNVVLKSGTRIMNDVHLADYVKTTGLCLVGNGVDARTGACISRAVIIEDNAFIGPEVMTNHTKNVAHKRPHIKEVQLITRIGYGAVVGSDSSLIAGLTIGDNVVIAASTNVYKDLIEPGIYVGNPLRKIRDLAPEFILRRPPDLNEYSLPVDLMRRYLPNWIGFAKDN